MLSTLWKNLEWGGGNFRVVPHCHFMSWSTVAIKRTWSTCSSGFAVITPKDHVCQTGNPIQVTQSRGILASLVAAETGCGTAHAPWHLRALPGQRINVTLLDFSWAAAGNDVLFLPASGRKSAPETAVGEVKNCFFTRRLKLKLSIATFIRHTEFVSFNN